VVADVLPYFIDMVVTFTFNEFDKVGFDLDTTGRKREIQANFIRFKKCNFGLIHFHLFTTDDMPKHFSRM